MFREKINATRKSANLPEALWMEIGKAAIYLLNRTPRYGLRWRMPYEVLHTRPGQEPRRSDVAHLRVYGCKAYAMTTEAMKKEKRLQRFNPKAWIGYLVGYRSSNIYRIWVPDEKRSDIDARRDLR